MLLAICEFCKQEIGKSKSCYQKNVTYIGRIKKNRICYQNTIDDKPCPSCKVSNGGYHHWGCEEEICPFCLDHIAFCDCTVVNSTL